ESVTSAEISVNGERITSGEITMLPGDDGIFSCSVLPENASNKSIVYTSSNEGVKVNAYGEFQAVSPCLAVIKAASQENENLYATISVTVKDIYAEGMEIANTPSSSLFVGQKTTISIRYIPENATSGRELEWNSDDESVASVSDGIVTAKKAGDAVITATLVSDRSVKIIHNVTVSEMPAPAEEKGKLTSFGIAFRDDQPTSNHSPSLPEQNEDGAYVVYVHDIYYLDLVQDNPDYNGGYLWCTSDKNVATHNNKDTVEFLSAGTATIVVTSNKYSLTSAIEFLVKDVIDDEITVTSDTPSLTIEKDADGRYIAEMPEKTKAFFDYTAGTVYVGVNVSDGDAVSFDEFEKSLVGKKTGEVTITFTVDAEGVSLKAVMILKVAENADYHAITEITVPSEMSIELKDSARAEEDEIYLDYSVNDDASVKQVTFSSDNESVLKIDGKTGLITPVSVGAAEVTVRGVDVFDPTADLPYATVTVTVYKTPVTYVNITDYLTEMDAGDKHGLHFETDGSIRELIWTCSDENVMRVTGYPEGATLTALAPGKVTITATAVDDPTIQNSVSITVKPVQIVLKSIAPSEESIEITRGNSANFTIDFSPNDASFKGIMLEISDRNIVSATYSATNSAVTVTVNALKKGTATVTVRSDTYDGVACSVGVKVVEILSENIKITSGDLTVDENDRLTVKTNASASLKVTLDKKATVKDVNFSSSDESVATVGADGVIAIRSAGETVITVSTTDGENTVSKNFILAVEKVSFKDTINDFYLIVRKSIGHFGAFMVLGILAALAYLVFSPSTVKGKIVAYLLCVVSGFAVAGITEMCQLPAFTTGRYCSFDDVILDFSGYFNGAVAVFAFALIGWAVAAFIQKRKNRRKAAPDFSEETAVADMTEDNFSFDDEKTEKKTSAVTPSEKDENT
ncbi:MAG: VanZ family protein, partial [Clostridia bacterium]|nr:VanZ family protein [Clostridia bacterium]